MFAVTVTFEVFEERMQDFLPLMRRNAETSLSQEPGCTQFDVCVDPSRPNEVFLYELYADAAAFDVHLNSPHFMDFYVKTNPMIASKALKTFAQGNP